MIDCRPLIHEIGRGPRGARSLSFGDAATLWSAIIDGQLPPAALGAALMAMRLKGESLDELRALREVVQGRLERFVGTRRPLVSMPCYNGARRVTNLSWLTALALRDAGFAVLMHGVSRDPERLTTHEVVEAAGGAIADTVGAAGGLLASESLVFVPIEVWCGPLASLLSVRAQTGVRNTGHIVAKLLRPAPEALLLTPVTHAHYLSSSIALLSDDEGPALVFRGVDGEPSLYPHAPRILHRIAAGADSQVAAGASPRIEAGAGPLITAGAEPRIAARPPGQRVDCDASGSRVTQVELAPPVSPDPAVALPAGADALAVARWSAEVLGGGRPMPSMIAGLVEQARIAVSIPGERT